MSNVEHSPNGEKKNLTLHQKIVKLRDGAGFSADKWYRIDSAVTKEFLRRTKVTTWLAGRYRLDLSRQEETQLKDDNIPLPDKCYEIVSMPLPLTSHEVVLNKNYMELEPVPDTTLLEVSARRVGEAIEEMLFKGAEFDREDPETKEVKKHTVQGLISCPERYTCNVPDMDIIERVLLMKKLLYENSYFGPYLVLHGRELDKELDNDSPRTKAAYTTTREDIKTTIEGIEEVMVSYHLPPKDMVMVQLTPDVIRIVTALNPVAYPEDGKWKVNAIIVPQIRVTPVKQGISCEPPQFQTGICHYIHEE